MTGALRRGTGAERPRSVRVILPLMATNPAASAVHRALLLAALTAVLLVGLIGMHHVSVLSDAQPPMSTVSEPAVPLGHDDGDLTSERQDDHGTALLHLCLAVLTAFGTVLAVLVAWPARRSVAWPTIRRGSRPRTSPRAPPPTAPARLALLCVLRT